MRSDRLKLTALAVVAALATLASQLAHADPPPPIVIETSLELGTMSIGRIEIPLTATGGNGTYSWHASEGLPFGVSVRNDVPACCYPAGASAGLVGVATAPGTFGFTLDVNNGEASQGGSLKVTLLRPKNIQRLPDAFAGTPYSYQLTALGNEGTPTWAPTTAEFPVPPGMTLEPDGTLWGTPTVAANYTIGTSLSDGTDTVFQGVSLQVWPISITTPGVLPNATQNVPYTASVAAFPGGASFSANGLPNGLSMDGAGNIYGTVTSGGGSHLGKFAVNVTASGGGNQYTKAMSIDVVGAAPTLPSISPYGNGFDDCTIGVPCSRGIGVFSGGTGPFTWTPLDLPAGMTIRSGDGVTSSWITPDDAEL